MRGTLLGNYRVVDKLGEGGMGAVYIGRHETLGHRVVVKVLLPELSSNHDMVQRLFNEAQAATAIRHPGIVQVFDFGATPFGSAYFVMELLEGETLGARLTRRRYDPAECCRLGRQIANVLQAAHTAGITHRDLKPDNLFLVPDPEVVGGERVKVLDFGIAKLADGARASGVKTHTGLVMGTPNYMSPEQCRSAASADARSDIYSLGCILFEMACGRPPFAGGLGDIVAAHLHEPPPHPQHLVPAMPFGLSALIVKMLAKQPGARPPSMAAVSQALDEILRILGEPPLRAQTPSLAGAPTLISRDSAPLLPVHAPPAPAIMRPPAAPPLQLPPASTTLRGAVATFNQSQAGSRRLPFLLGVVVVIGAVTAIAIVLANGGSAPPSRLVSYDNMAVSHTADAAAIEPRKTAQPPGPSAKSVVPEPTVPPAAPTPPVVPAAPPETKPTMTAADLEAACRGYQLDRKWTELEQCADKLKPLDATRAEELRTRATEEAKSAPRITAARAALHDKDLKRAKTELDQVWNQSIDYAGLKRSYDGAEAQAIDALATQLDSMKDTSCDAYNQLLAKERATISPRVLAEAIRRVPCIPPPKCNADALAEQGRQQFGANQFADSLASYDAAYSCRPASTLLQKAFVVACNLHNVAKAKSYWKRMPQALRTQALGTCVRNGISEAVLNAP